MKKIINNKEKILKIIFVFSLPFLSVFLSSRFTYVEIIKTFFISLILGLILVNINFTKELKEFDIKKLIIAVIFSLYLCNIHLNYCNTNTFFTMNILDKIGINLSFNYASIILSLMALPSLILFIYNFIFIFSPLIKKFYYSLDKLEKNYLLVILILGFFLTVIIFYYTNVFFQPATKDLQFDIIYTTDSAYLVNEDVYSNINMSQNDLRQPLFGLFSLPFALIAKILSTLLYFIPHSYIVLINTFQILLLAISTLLICRMLNIIDKKEKLLFLMSIFATYPYIIFSFAMEQYIIALFFLILTIYISFFNYFKVNYFYIGAVGTILTSGIIFPLITKFKNIKKWVINLMKCLFAFIVTVTISGQLPLFFNFKEQFKLFIGFSGKNILFINKLQQYIYFVKSLIFAPSSYIIFEDGTYRYWLKTVNHFDVIGLIIILLCVVSFFLNRKNKFALISFLWIIFSFVILCLFGWGTRENGLILYSLYFSWAFISLLYLFIKKIINNIKYRNIFFLIIIFCMLVINISEFIRIFKFGLKYYGG